MFSDTDKQIFPVIGGRQYLKAVVPIRPRIVDIQISGSHLIRFSEEFLSLFGHGKLLSRFSLNTVQISRQPADFKWLFAVSILTAHDDNPAVFDERLDFCLCNFVELVATISDFTVSEPQYFHLV